jgi:hypothetical protein
MGSNSRFGESSQELLPCILQTVESELHEQWSHFLLFRPDRVRFKFKCIEPDPTQLKKSIFICVLFKKIRRKSLDDVVFAEFDRNLNFVPDVVACLRNQGNCSPCRMYFVRDGIIDNLNNQ